MTIYGQCVSDEELEQEAQADFASAWFHAHMEDHARTLCGRYGIDYESCLGNSWASVARWALVLAADAVSGNPNVIYSSGRDMMYSHAARHMVSHYLNEPTR